MMSIASRTPPVGRLGGRIKRVAVGYDRPEQEAVNQAFQQGSPTRAMPQQTYRRSH